MKCNPNLVTLRESILSDVLPLNLVGSRYFVIAANAARIVFLQEAAIDFLIFTGKRHGGNKLEKDVYLKLQDPLMLSKSKELGKSALDMNLHY